MFVFFSVCVVVVLVVVIAVAVLVRSCCSFCFCCLCFCCSFLFFVFFVVVEPILEPQAREQGYIVIHIKLGPENQGDATDRC